MSEGRVGEILNCDESVDLQKSLTPEIQIKPFGWTKRDGDGQLLCWWRIKCSTLGYWERQGDGKTQWRCQDFRVAADSG